MDSCTIRKNKITGPYFFETKNVNGNNYRRIMVDFSFPSFNRLRNDNVSMQHGASPYFATSVRNYLNRERLNNGIGKVDLLNSLYVLRI